MTTADTSTNAPRHGFRRDVEGLRGVAVGLVLLFHAGLGWLPGGFVGVDVFFVISGFVITSSLLTENRSTGTFSLTRFYVRRVRRLLPASSVVLVTVAALTVLCLPQTRWRVISGDIAASAGYVVNWRLADNAVDYLAVDSAPSPVQHFWSLAVEEQFYLLWPCLLLLVIAWARRQGSQLDRLVVSVLAAVGLASLGWSVWLTEVEPARAYFVTTTRLWELALGGLLAVLVGHRARLLSGPFSAVLGWAGLAMILLAGVFLSKQTAYPGLVALLPTLGAAAVIASGSRESPRGPVLILGRPSLQRLGALSYSLYLWHWPVLVVATARWGPLSLAEGLLVVTFSAGPAWLTYHVIENPVRRSTLLLRAPRSAVALGVTCTAAALSAGLLVRPPASPPLPVAAASTSGELGTAATGRERRSPPGAGAGDPAGPIVPDPLEARQDAPRASSPGCHAEEPDDEARRCRYGAADSDTTIVLVGDSHARQWIPALERIAARRGWTLLTYTKSSCPFADVQVAVRGRPSPSCRTWNRNVVKELTAAPPTLVITSSSRYQVVLRDGELSPAGDYSGLAEGLGRAWRVLLAANIPTVAIRDTPYPGVDVPECVSVHRAELWRCSISWEVAAENGGVAQSQAAADLPDVHVIDLNDDICPAAECAAVVGGVLVYRDGSHLTATYVKSLQPRLEEELDAVLARVRP